MLKEKRNFHWCEVDPGPTLLSSWERERVHSIRSKPLHTLLKRALPLVVRCTSSSYFLLSTAFHSLIPRAIILQRHRGKKTYLLLWITTSTYVDRFSAHPLHSPSTPQRARSDHHGAEQEGTYAARLQERTIWFFRDLALGRGLAVLVQHAHDGV